MEKRGQDKEKHRIYVVGIGSGSGYGKKAVSGDGSLSDTVS